MTGYLLYSRLNKLSKEEFLRFEAFIRSPYFQKGEKAIQMMDLVKNFYPDFVLTKTVKNKILKIVPSKSSHDVLLSRMNDLLDEFEIYEEFNKREYLKRSLRYEVELEKKNNLKLYHQLQIKTEKNIKSSDDYYADFYMEFSSIAVCENNWITDKALIISHSEKAMSNILYFFLSKYLLVFANRLTHSLNIPPTEEGAVFQRIISYVNEHIEEQPVSLQCISYIIHLFRNISGDKNEFDYYLKMIKQKTFTLKKEEISYEIKYALIQTSSACVFKCYSDPGYFQEAFEIIQFLVKNDLYFSELHEQLLQQRFILIVKIALGANQVEWAKEFIESKIHLISKHAQADLYNYAFGLICFNLSQYNEAVKLMVKINLNSAQFTADYKITLLKMYYELDEPAGFNYQSQTFLKFLGKDKSLNKMHKKNIIDSVELIKWLFKFKKNKNFAAILEKIESRKLDYLIRNYRDKWYSEKFESLVNPK